MLERGVCLKGERDSKKGLKGRNNKNFHIIMGKICCFSDGYAV